MNQKQNIFSSAPKPNSTNFFSKNINFPSNSIFSKEDSNIPLFPSIQKKKHNVVKKRTYNELMESYKEKQYNQYKREDEEEEGEKERTARRRGQMSKEERVVAMSMLTEVSCMFFKISTITSIIT